MNLFKNYQFICWFPKWLGFHFLTFTDIFGEIYKWSIQLGYFEIRRWRE